MSQPTIEPPMRLIGGEWIEHGYENLYIAPDPDPCIIDGTPLNACTHAITEMYQEQEQEDGEEQP